MKRGDAKQILSDGFVTIEQYDNLLTSEFFKKIEASSNNFNAKVGPLIHAYDRKWVPDPLHQWSRQWEYPYVISKIMDEKRSASIMDLGAGLTFLPYLLKEELGFSQVTAVDYDKMLANLYDRVNKKLGSAVDFSHGDMRNLSSVKKSSVDFVFSISVLEHTNAYDQILKEIYRILRPGGKLCFTFDISIDGLDDIPPARAKALVSSLERIFKVRTGIDVLDSIEAITNPLVTSRIMAAKDRKLVPWRYPMINVAKPLVRHRRLGSPYKNLTFCCVTVEKRK